VVGRIKLPWSHIHISTVIAKLQQSLYMPGRAVMVRGGWGSQIFRQSVLDGVKVVSPTQRPSLPPGNISLRRWVRSEELSHWKIPMTPSGIDPTSFRFSAPCLNQLHHHVTPQSYQTSCLTVRIKLCPSHTNPQSLQPACIVKIVPPPDKFNIQLNELQLPWRWGQHVSPKSHFNYKISSIIILRITHH
jgi:hypothetical protein